MIVSDSSPTLGVSCESHFVEIRETVAGVGAISNSRRRRGTGAPRTCNSSHALSFFMIVTLGSLCVSSGLAAPQEEIQNAVIAGGSASVDEATAPQFIMAFSSVAVHVKKQTLTENLTAGIKLRGDLAPEITVAALRVQRTRQDFKDGPDACLWVDSIIRAAILAAPSQKRAIVHAAVEADPAARECIFAAARMSDGINATAFFRPSGVDAGNIDSSTTGTINPGNFSGHGDIVSPFRP